MSPRYPHPDNYAIPEPNELRRMRRLAGMSRSDAVDALPVTRTELENMEHGDDDPTLEELETLFELYRPRVPEPRADGTAPKIQDDPHGVVPHAFWYFFRSLAQAQRNLGNKDDSKKRRCPECESVDIRPLSSRACSRSEHEWRCKREDCGAGFDEPLPPEEPAADADRGRDPGEVVGGDPWLDGEADEVAEVSE
jgi:DNA-binding XRE family transcriptional regulator